MSSKVTRNLMYAHCAPPSFLSPSKAVEKSESSALTFMTFQGSQLSRAIFRPTDGLIFVKGEKRGKNSHGLLAYRT